MIVAAPVGPYFATGFQPVSLYCEDFYARSFDKGFGHYKLGAYLFSLIIILI